MKPRILFSFLIFSIFTGTGFSQRVISDTMYVMAHALNLREQPSSNALILAVAAYGEAVEVLNPEVDWRETPWLEVQYGERRGYMSANYLTTGIELMMVEVSPHYLPPMNYYALFSTEKGDSLKRVEVYIEPDEEFGPWVAIKEPHKYGAFLIIGSIDPLPEGLVNNRAETYPDPQPLYPGMNKKLCWTDPTATKCYSLLAFGTFYRTEEGYYQYQDYRLEALCYNFNNHSECRQAVLDEPWGKFWEPAYLFWEGDFNRDGFPDFILQRNEEEHSGQFLLFLGQEAEAGKVVRKMSVCMTYDRC